MAGVAGQSVLSAVLTVILWTGAAFVSQNIQYSSARQFYGNVIQQLENSDFSYDVIDKCRAEAEQNGYHLSVELYGKEDCRDARVILDMDFIFPVTQVARRFTMEGYAR